MQGSFEPIESAIRRALWEVDLASSPRWRVWLVRGLRVLQALTRDLADGQLSLRAMSLVYTTLLSLVPLLAVSFSVLKGFGVHNQIEPALLNLLATPLGDRAEEVTRTIIGFVDNMQVGVLGSLGVGILLYTAVSLIQKVENAFNMTWRTTQTRSFGQRFSDYLSVILVGPVLLFSLLGASASVLDLTFVRELTSTAPLGLVVDLVGQGVPYLFLVAAFTFVYKFVPNTQVRLLPAAAGAIVAGILWVIAGLIFGNLVASSARYGAIYSGLGIGIVFMMWTYVAWLILLIGAKASFCVQHPEYLTPDPELRRLSHRLRERCALLIAYAVARDFADRRPAKTLPEIAGWLGMPSDLVGEVVDALVGGGILLRTEGDEIAFVPAATLEQIRLHQVLEAIRTAEEGGVLAPGRLPAASSVDALVARLEEGRSSALEERTLADLVREPDPLL